MDSETSSSVDEQLGSVAAADTRGKHRILAELKRVEQESKFLQEELEELEKTDNVSKVAALHRDQTRSSITTVNFAILISKLMAPRTPLGIDGLKVHRTRKAADAIFSDQKNEFESMAQLNVDLVLTWCATADLVLS
ncbi:hypothetical protein ACFE04_012451 [Oxalis oulophora]